MKEQIKNKLLKFEEEYFAIMKKFNSHKLSEEELDRGSDLELWISDLKIYLQLFESKKKISKLQYNQMNVILLKE
jgi:hypothetical protein